MISRLRGLWMTLHDAQRALIDRASAARTAWVAIVYWLVWDICAAFYWQSDSLAAADAVWILPLLLLFSASEIVPARELPGWLGYAARVLAMGAFASILIVALHWWSAVTVALSGPLSALPTTAWPHVLTSYVAALIIGVQVAPPMVRTLIRTDIRVVCLACAAALLWWYCRFLFHPTQWLDVDRNHIARLFRALASPAILYGVSVLVDSRGRTLAKRVGRSIPDWLVAHWRGSGSKWLAWLGFLLAIAIVQWLIGWRNQDPGLQDDGFFSDARAIVTWPSVIILSYLGAMPLWRGMSGLSKPHPWWATLSRGLVVTGAGLLMLDTLVIEGPRVGFLFEGVVSHALHADWAVDVLPQSTAIGVRGDISYGLADELSHAIKAHPEVTSVHLFSPGGSTDIAAKAAAVIHDAGLNTYVRRTCESACTLLFAAGRERVLVPGGGLGYHGMRPEVPGLLRPSEVRADDALVRGLRR